MPLTELATPDWLINGAETAGADIANADEPIKRAAAAYFVKRILKSLDCSGCETNDMRRLRFQNRQWFRASDDRAS